MGDRMSRREKHKNPVLPCQCEKTLPSASEKVTGKSEKTKKDSNNSRVPRNRLYSGAL